ncbi:MAG: LysR family transcriptional regulator [Clostridiales bacterium]|nr:LysR family transcriptional regulator [Clostridiales bacterium]
MEPSFSSDAPVLNPNIQVRLALGERLVFGPGTAELLRGIAKYGSIHRACTEMTLSYSKGRAMLRGIEEQLHLQIVHRTQGGPGGGSARLTEAGEALLQQFTDFEAAVQQYAVEQFEQEFSFPKQEETL